MLTEGSGAKTRFIPSSRGSLNFRKTCRKKVEAATRLSLVPSGSYSRQVVKRFIPLYSSRRRLGGKPLKFYTDDPFNAVRVRTYALTLGFALIRQSI